MHRPDTGHTTGMLAWPPSTGSVSLAVPSYIVSSMTACCSLLNLFVLDKILGRNSCAPDPFAHGGVLCLPNDVDVGAGKTMEDSRLHIQRTHAAVAAPEAPATSTSSQPEEQIVKMYSRLQNGSDVRGIAVDGTGKLVRLERSNDS